jgi:hypothetical protein
VAKRVRGSHSTHRPGGHAPVRSTRPAGAAPTVGSAVTPSAWAPTADSPLDPFVMETTEVTFQEPMPPTPATSRARRRTTVKADSLQARVAAENVYVREDLRRIAVVTAILVAGLAVAWVLFVVLNVLGLY